MTHYLKTWSEEFSQVWDGYKKFEIRKDDRGYQVGDTLVLEEGDLGGAGMTDHDLTFVYTGRVIEVNVMYILKGGKFGIEKDYVAMSIDLLGSYKK